jgi:YVTN family beta-propeller protein
MNFRILGPLEVLDDERLLDVGGGKQRSVLALLLLNANEVVSSDRLIDELWPEEPPASAAKIIHAHVSRLRKALDGAGDAVLQTRGHGYVLRVQPGQLDLDRFRELLKEGRAVLAVGNAEAAAATLHAALALWRGPPLAEFTYESFAQEEIARLEELRLAALEERIEADLALARHDDVVQELEQLVRRHPLRERLRGQLMLALYRSGRQAEALDVYRDGRALLVQELGLEPGRTLQELERAILTQAPELEAPAGRPRVVKFRVRRPGVLLVAGGALVLLVAAISAAVVELRGRNSAGLSSLARNSVGVIDPSTDQIVAQIPVGSRPTRLGISRAALWVIGPDAGTVSRIDPKAKRVVRTIAVGGRPTDMGVSDESLWIWNAAHADPVIGISPARLLRIDTAANDIRRAIPIERGHGLDRYSVAVGASAVWVVDTEPPETVFKFDPDTGKVVDQVEVGGPAPRRSSATASPGNAIGGPEVVVGQGSVWVLAGGGVARINLRTRSVSTIPSSSASVPVALTIGEGAIWVVSRPDFRCCPLASIGTGTLSRIDPRTNSITETITLAGNPAGVAVGGGAVWVANAGSRSVIKVDPKERSVKTIKIGGRPLGIAFGRGAVWVAAG